MGSTTATQRKLNGPATWAQASNCLILMRAARSAPDELSVLVLNRYGHDAARGVQLPSVMIHLTDLCMHYDAGAGRVDVLRGVNLGIGTGECVAVTGPSGCGKTTLLLLLAALERPVSGSIAIDGVDLITLDADALADLRRDRIGIVFQSFHLIPSLTALDNVAIPLEIARRRDARPRAQEMLERVGLSARERHYPSQLSGGEQQRVAIARSLVHRPALVLADEPTGNLDEETGAMVSNALFELIREAGATFVLVTHDLSLVHACHRVLRLHEGALEEHTTPGVASQTAGSPAIP